MDFTKPTSLTDGPNSGVTSVDTSNIRPVYILVQNPVTATSNEKHFEKTFPRKVATVLAAVQLAACAMSFISELVLILADGYSRFTEVGTGIWCGVFFGISGGLGLLAAQKPAKCSIVAFMVMSIISACLCLPYIILAAIGAGLSRNTYYNTYDHNDVSAAFFVIEVILALTMGVAAIVSSALSCRAICCRKSKSQGSVLYNPVGNDGQPIPLQQIVHPGAQVPLSGVAHSESYPPPTYENTVETEEGDGHYKRLE